MKIYFMRENSNFSYYKFTVEIRELTSEQKELISSMFNKLAIALNIMERQK